MKASDFLKELEQDQEYQERINKLKAERKVIHERRMLDEQPIVNDLNSTGFNIKSIWDLINREIPYPEALPILFFHRRGNYLNFTRDAIYRTMSVYDASPYVNDFLQDFREEADNDLRWTIGNAISAAATSENADGIRDIIECTQYGNSRSSLIEGLANIEQGKAISYFMDKMNEPELTAECIIQLGKLNAKDAVNSIKTFVHSKDEWIREQAKKALKRLTAD